MRGGRYSLDRLIGRELVFLGEQRIGLRLFFDYRAALDSFIYIQRLLGEDCRRTEALFGFGMRGGGSRRADFLGIDFFCPCHTACRLISW